jgi:hypothetical protein
LRLPPSTDVREDAIFVEGKKGQGYRLGSRRDDDVLRPVGRRRSIRSGDFHDVAGAECSFPLRPDDLVLLEEELDALGVVRDDGGLSLLHRREVERNLTDGDAMLSCVQPHELVVLR